VREVEQEQKKSFVGSDKRCVIQTDQKSNLDNKTDMEEPPPASSPSQIPLGTTADSLPITISIKGTNIKDILKVLFFFFCPLNFIIGRTSWNRSCIWGRAVGCM
jgi:hypothetical protein